MNIEHKTPAPIRRDQINTGRAETVDGGFAYQGRVYQSDAVSREAIGSKVQTLLLRQHLGQSVPASVAWWDIDNTRTEFSLNEFYAFALALGEWALAVVEQARTEKDQL